MSLAGTPVAPHAAAGALPEGTLLFPLPHFGDERGRLSEIHRDEWQAGFRPAQWNLVHSGANVLRGVHVHLRHADWLHVASGRATVGLRDLRPRSATHGRVACVELDGAAPSALLIPPGVAHGFYFHEPSIHVYGVTHAFDPKDELGCRFDDPGLGIPWPTRSVVLSPRDRDAPSLARLCAAVEEVFPR